MAKSHAFHDEARSFARQRVKRPPG
jgi:hypothetical protein